MNIFIRQAKPDDHEWIVTVLDASWGRPVAPSVPRLFLDHFYSTSLVAEHNDQPVGFLIGFLSPSQERSAYVHFIGVDPEQRSRSLGRQLYERFFELAGGQGCTEVQAITNAINEDSVAFHRRLGFAVSEPIADYDRPGLTHVRFCKRIEQ